MNVVDRTKILMRCPQWIKTVYYIQHGNANTVGYSYQSIEDKWYMEKQGWRRQNITRTFNRNSRSRHFWCRGYYVDIVRKNSKKIKEYIKNQLQEDLVAGQLSLKEYIDPFMGETVQKSKKKTLQRKREKVMRLANRFSATSVADGNSPLQGQGKPSAESWSWFINCRWNCKAYYASYCKSCKNERSP